MRVLRLAHLWRADEGTSPLEPRLFMLLDAIMRLGSLQKAAREAGLSYRHAWGFITASSLSIGKLVNLERGRGAALTELGEQLLELDRKASLVLAPHFARLERELADLTQTAAPSSVKSLVMHASHDPALESLRDAAQHSSVRVELHTHGSLESLESLARGQCDAAGFHLPEKVSPALARRYAARLRKRPLSLVNFAERRQGLIVKRGNPKGISRVSDLARSGVRFVNRQPGSGTRLLLDELIGEHGVSTGSIIGYHNEEFTHAAVAAIVASGMADVGLGVETAAKQHALDFIPLVREHYYFAVRSDAAGAQTLELLQTVVRSRKFRAHVSKLKGYDFARCGSTAAVDRILQT